MNMDVDRNAMSEEHDAHETAKNDSDPAVNRRRFVKTLGATGLAATGLSSVASAQTDPKQMDVDVTILHGASRQHVLTAALSDDDTKKITQKLTESGWKQNIDDAKCALSEPDDVKSYHVVVIPFESSDTDKTRNKSQGEQVNLRWTDRVPEKTNMERVSAHHVTESKKNKNNVEMTMTTYNVESDRVVSQTEKFNDTQNAEYSPDANIAPPPSGGGCPDYQCRDSGRVCDSYNWGCIYFIAGTYATAIPACATCDSIGVTCTVCVFDVLNLFGGSSFNCDIGNNCRNRSRCIPCCSTEPPNGCA